MQSSESIVEEESELDKWINAKAVMIGSLSSGTGKPMLRPIGMWAIKGSLTFAEMSEEVEWLVVDDGSDFRLFDPSEEVLLPPRLEYLPAMSRSISERNEFLINLLSESRRTNSEDNSSLSQMRQWIFSIDTAQIHSIECYKPEWV